MKLKSLFSIVATVGVLAASAALAGEFGTADEAKAMLTKAAAAVKADKAAALAQFNKGEGGFKDRDLYPFCGGADGNFTAHPTLVGKSLKELKDKNGKALGEEIYSVAKEGEVKEVNYVWNRPGQTEVVPKVSFVTRIGDQTCVVGYYK
jgi:signal transduction histidine kinase